MKADKFFAFVAGVTIAASSTVPAFAGSRTIELTNETVSALGIVQEVEGGIWQHDTWVDGNVKSVYSNYYHSDKWHRASCRIGEKKDGNPTYQDSGFVEPGRMAESSTSGPKNERAFANYDTLN